MNYLFKIFVMSVGLLGVAVPLQAQLAPASRVAFAEVRSMSAGLRAGGRSYIRISPTFGREVLAPTGSSVIGNAGQQKYWRTLQKTNWLGPKISNQIARQVAKVPRPEAFPGVIVSFKDKWAEFHQTTGHTLESLSVVLEAAYGESASAEGSFVSSFEEVRALSTTPVLEGVDFLQAMRDAFAQAQEVKNGFFVLRIKGNADRPKDTLVLALSGEENSPGFYFISLNRSAGHAWSRRLGSMKK